MIFDNSFLKTYITTLSTRFYIHFWSAIEDASIGENVMGLKEEIRRNNTYFLTILD